MANSEQRIVIAELVAEIPSHLRRVQAVAKSLDGPVREALEHYEVAGLQAVIELQRERRGVKHHG